MGILKCILVATDFSERSDRAVRRAVLLARQTGAALSLVHVVDDDQPRQIVESEFGMASQLLEEQAKTLESVDGVSCHAEVRLGDAFAGILAAGQEQRPTKPGRGLWWWEAAEGMESRRWFWAAWPKNSCASPMWMCL
ncbi:UspA domain-containing protein [Nitratireductor indicus C115]|uniref:UspA domain-containing protein n=1 Tax=Nitratireductor indicus C115 TaxID=1231190 RepID=K2NRE5_9HYPH|nr:universal stress protein [Nitratireductor indicus]EKF41950.1 UspA domain-containing protein [Nitratireductor indicus C115]SFQ47845.1 Universal stress protein family protein [Nitratireductor indicus]